MSHHLHSSLFVAEDGDLTQWFPGWKRPLAAPIPTTVRNPLTGKPMDSVTWDPDPAHPSTNEGSVWSWDMAPHQVFSDAEYLEAGAHPLVRCSPHAVFRGALVLHLIILRGVLSGNEVEGDGYDAPLFPPARISPPGIDPTIDVVPPDLVTALAQLSPEQIAPLARSWCDRCGDLSEDGAAARLEALHKLATLASARGARLYLMSAF
jgi:hypothetical protein